MPETWCTVTVTDAAGRRHSLDVIASSTYMTLRISTSLMPGNSRRRDCRCTMRTIHLQALDRNVTLAAYLRAVRMAKANPDITFKTGLTTWWPTTGAEVMVQFREGMMERINQAVPYIQRGRKQ